MTTESPRTARRAAAIARAYAAEIGAAGRDGEAAADIARRAAEIAVRFGVRPAAWLRVAAAYGAWMAVVEAACGDPAADDIEQEAIDAIAEAEAAAGWGLS